MLRFIRTLLLATSTMTMGCTSNFKTEMQNSPMANLTGNQIYVDVASPNGETLSTPFSDIIKEETYKYLAMRGFTKANSKADAHMILFFSPGHRDRTVNVPGQTYLVPVYKDGQQTNFNASSNNGSYVYGSTRSQGTTQWHTGYREGYTVQAQDQWLHLDGYFQENGTQPKQAFQGQIWRTSNKVAFFSNENALREGVLQLLNKTMLATIKQAPTSISNVRPGCRPMLGFEVDQEEAKNSGANIIKRVIPNSAAEDAGLKLGDDIRTLAGYPYSELSSNPERAAKIYQSGSIKVVVVRNSNDREFKIEPKELCPD